MPRLLCECNFTSNFSLGRLHCLSDCIASLCKCVGSYFGLLLRAGNPNPTAFTLPSRWHPSARAVETRTPPAKHSQFCYFQILPTRAARRAPENALVEEAGIEPASSTHQLQPSEMDLATSHDHVHCGSTKPRVKVFGRLAPTLKCDDCGLSALWALRHTTNHHA